AVELTEQLLDGDVDVVGGHRHAGGGPHDRTHHPDGGPLDRQDLLDPPAANLREAEQPQGLAGRGAVNHDQVVVAALTMAIDPEQVGQFFHARQDADLVGDDVVDLAPGQQ